MANIVKTYSFVNGQPADATQVNQNFDDIIAGVGNTADLHPEISAAGAALIDDADAAAQRATLGGVVVGPASATDNAIVRADGATGKLVQNSSVIIDDVGSVGIGTTTPAEKLEVNGNILFSHSDATLRRIWTGTNGGTVQLQGDGGTANRFARIGVSDVAGGWDKGITVVASGSVGIGTITPASQLSINGGLHVGGDSDAGDNNLLVDGTLTVAGQAAVLTNDSRLSNARPASDVSAWAKAGTKPAYNNTEVGAAATSHTHSKSQITDMPTSLPASDVYAWAKAASKPSYTAAEVGSRKIATGSVLLNTSVPTVVTHGLGATPTFLVVISGTQLWSPTAITSTTFTLSNGTATVQWLAVA